MAFILSVLHIRTIIFILILCSTAFSAAYGKTCECLIITDFKTAQAAITSQRKEVVLPYWTDDCKSIEVIKGKVSILFRDSQGGVSAMTAEPGDSIEKMADKIQKDSGFLQRALAIIVGGSETVHFAGKLLSSKAVFPELPYDSVYIGETGLSIDRRQYYLEPGSGSSKAKRTDFTIDTLILENVDTAKSQTFHPDSKGKINIPASAFEYDKEYAWIVHIGSKSVKRRFFSIDEETEEELDQIVTQLKSRFNPKNNGETYHILLAGIFDDMGCGYQSLNLLKSYQKGDER